MNERVELSIPTMKCAGCVNAIEKALSTEAAVAKANVDLTSKTALVETSLTHEALANVVKTAGFEVSNFTTLVGEL